MQLATKEPCSISRMVALDAKAGGNQRNGRLSSWVIIFTASLEGQQIRRRDMSSLSTELARGRFEGHEGSVA